MKFSPDYHYNYYSIPVPMSTEHRYISFVGRRVGRRTRSYIQLQSSVVTPWSHAYKTKKTANAYCISRIIYTAPHHFSWAFSEIGWFWRPFLIPPRQKFGLFVRTPSFPVLPPMIVESPIPTPRPPLLSPPWRNLSFYNAFRTWLFVTYSQRVYVFRILRASSFIIMGM